MNKKLNVVELFAGIGGFKKGIEKSSKVKTEFVFVSEFDNYAQLSYESLHKQKPKGDITKIHVNEIPEHDLLVGGFPCQSFSIAGKQQGFCDTRGTLFFEVIRIAKEKQPKIIFLENVKNLVNHDKGFTLDVMLETLSKTGYVVDFEVLDSKHYGVPQNRERTFIIGVRSDLIDSETWSNTNNTMVGKAKKRNLKKIQNGRLKTFNFEWPNKTIIDTNLISIIEPTVEDFYYMDDKAESIISSLNKKSKNENTLEEIEIYDKVKEKTEKVHFNKEIPIYKRKHFIDEAELCQLFIQQKRKLDLTKKEISKKLNTRIETVEKWFDTECFKVPERYLWFELKDILNIHTDKYDQAITEFELIFCEYDSKKDLYIPKQKQKNRLIPQNSIMVGLLDMKGTDSIRRVYNPLSYGPTLTTSSGGHREVKVVVREVVEEVNEGFKTRLRVRKLTPLESFRLQGFTDFDYDLINKAKISNHQKYKQIGNAVTPQVIAAIMEKLNTYL